MPNSSSFGRRSGGTVTVIEAPVRRSANRNAKIAAIVTWVIVSLLATTVTASRWHPIIALFAGVLIGLAAAFVVGVAVLIWPVVRTIWWWLPEFGLAFGLVAGWTWLADRLSFPYLLGVATTIVAVPAAIPLIRCRLVALAWCLVTRHRIRTCFAEFIVYNRTGSLPLIMWCIPTPVGERLWIHLRPGLTLDAIQDRAGQIAVTCWADSVVVTAASVSNSAYLRIDIKRRDALTGTVISPLLGHLIPGVPGRNRDTSQVPDALDLPDVSPADVTPQQPAPSRLRKVPAAVPAPALDVTGDDNDDVRDWL